MWILEQFEKQERCICIMWESCLDWLLTFINICINVMYLLKLKNWSVSPEFRLLCLVAGNRYLQCDDEREVGVLDEAGGLTVGVD